MDSATIAYANDVALRSGLMRFDNVYYTSDGQLHINPPLDQFKKEVQAKNMEVLTIKGEQLTIAPKEESTSKESSSNGTK
jgi:hypothetical protein